MSEAFLKGKISLQSNRGAGKASRNLEPRNRSLLNAAFDSPIPKRSSSRGRIEKAFKSFTPA